MKTENKLHDVVMNQSRSDLPDMVAALGSDMVKLMTDFWLRGAEAFTLVGAAGTLQFCNGETSFTKEEYIAFRKGLGVIPEAMMQCATHIAGQQKPEDATNEEKKP